MPCKAIFGKRLAKPSFESILHEGVFDKKAFALAKQYKTSFCGQNACAKDSQKPSCQIPPHVKHLQNSTKMVLRSKNPARDSQAHSCPIFPYAKCFRKMSLQGEKLRGRFAKASCQIFRMRNTCERRICACKSCAQDAQ